MIKLDIINEVVNRTGITKTKAEMAVSNCGKFFFRCVKFLKRQLLSGRRSEELNRNLLR